MMTLNALPSGGFGWLRPRRHAMATCGVLLLVALALGFALLVAVLDVMVARRGAPARVDQGGGSIVGAWKANCENAQGMVVAISSQGASATGRIRDLGRASQFSYRKGEEILRLTRDGSGWSGQLLVSDEW